VAYTRAARSAGRPSLARRKSAAPEIRCGMTAGPHVCGRAEGVEQRAEVRGPDLAARLQGGSVRKGHWKAQSGRETL
jgi:hypothetical protein